MRARFHQSVSIGARFLADDMYDKAPTLRKHSKKLRLFHARQRFVLAVCCVVDAPSVQMVAELVDVLRIKSPPIAEYLRVVGRLRCVRHFPENTLRIQFLRFRAQVDAPPANGISAQCLLVALCNTARDVVFNIVTQYRAAFADPTAAPLDVASHANVATACADAHYYAFL